MSQEPRRIVRIAVFYDGHYLYHVSNYYQYYHQRNGRININGLHSFICNETALRENEEPLHCRMVEGHYFRGRLRASEAQPENIIKERLFEDVLIREGITPHYLPLGPDGEKGVDVLLALEAFDRCLHKRFDVCALIACDGDYVSLVRKLHSIGCRVMLLAWNFKYTDQNGAERETRTSQSLIDEVTYPVLMHQRIDDPVHGDDAIIRNLFLRSTSMEFTHDATVSTPVPRSTVQEFTPDQTTVRNAGSDVSSKSLTGFIDALKDGYGFIMQHGGGKNLFFHGSYLKDSMFEDLTIGQEVMYDLGENDQGPCAYNVRPLFLGMAGARGRWDYSEDDDYKFDLDRK